MLKKPLYPNTRKVNLYDLEVLAGRQLPFRNNPLKPIYHAKHKDGVISFTTKDSKFGKFVCSGCKLEWGLQWVLDPSKTNDDLGARFVIERDPPKIVTRMVEVVENGVKFTKLVEVPTSFYKNKTMQRVNPLKYGS